MGVGAMCPSQPMTMTVFLDMHPEKQALLYNNLMDVSLPSSAKRGQYVSPTQMKDMSVDMHTASANAVAAWLQASGLPSAQLSPWSDMMALNASYAKIRKAFPTISCTPTPSHTRRARNDLVQNQKKKASASTAPTQCHNVIVPATLREHVAHVLIAPRGPLITDCGAHQRQQQQQQQQQRRQVRGRRSASNGFAPACSLNGDPNVDYMSEVYPPYVAYEVGSWTETTGNMLSAPFFVIPRCYSTPEKYQFFSSTTNIAFQNVTVSNICDGVGLLESSLTLTPSTGNPITFTATNCITVPLFVCTDVSFFGWATEAPLTIVSCSVNVTVPMNDHIVYNASVTTKLANNSIYTAPLCLFSNGACLPTTIVPTLSKLPADVRALYNIHGNASDTSVSQAVLTPVAPNTHGYLLSDVVQFQSMIHNTAFDPSSIQFVSAPNLTSPDYLPYVQTIATGLQIALQGTKANVTLNHLNQSSEALDDEPALDVQWLSSIGEV